MSGTACIEVAAFDALPPDAIALLEAAPGIFAAPSWWRTVLAHALPPGTVACFIVIRYGQRIAAVVPMLPGSGLTTPYTCEYAPALAPGQDHVAAMTAFARLCRARGVTRLDAVPAEWDGLPALLAGARRAGLCALPFAHFGNWYEDVAGLDWAAYLLRRPGALRETVRRRLRRAERLDGARFDLLTRPEEMDTAAAAFESVYARSWKEPEPYPDFNVALIRAMARAGWLRFGLWSIGAEAVAVQLWVLRDDAATVLKLAHDEAYKAHSPGTVLTALMLRHLLDNERVARIDFGRGDDDYKQGWASQRRQRIGLLLVNPLRPAGAAALLRHAAGRLRARLRR
jgi:CelD/BcsL family acetyltransferase involved in cellulose biosynthesis